MDLRNEPGIKQAEVIFGAETAEMIANFWSDLDYDFSKSICNHAYGTMYSRTVLTSRVRELCAVMALVALDKQPQLAVHIKAALNCGATREEITEVILQAHLYAGIPATMNALTTLRNTLKG